MRAFSSWQQAPQTRLGLIQFVEGSGVKQLGGSPGQWKLPRDERQAVRARKSLGLLAVQVVPLVVGEHRNRGESPCLGKFRLTASSLVLISCSVITLTK